MFLALASVALEIRFVKFYEVTCCYMSFVLYLYLSYALYVAPLVLASHVNGDLSFIHPVPFIFR